MHAIGCGEKEGKGNSIPCDSISTAELDGGKFNGPLFIAAMTRLGLSTTHNGYKNYTITGSLDNLWIDGVYSSATQVFAFRGLNERQAAQVNSEIRQAYSAEIVRTQAKRFGWQLKETGKNQFQVLRR